jgi:hypothetical protein
MSNLKIQPTMKTKKQKDLKPVIKSCWLISEAEKKGKELFTTEEKAVFNTYFHFLDLRKTSEVLFYNFAYCTLLLDCAIIKLHYLQSNHLKKSLVKN